jgi:hypothetical protein
MDRAKRTIEENKRLQEEKKLAEQQVIFFPTRMLIWRDDKHAPQAMENEEKKIAFFAEEKERKMRLRAEREAGERRESITLFVQFFEQNDARVCDG